MKTRLITAAILIAIFVPAFIVGGLFFKAVGMVMVLFSIKEILAIKKERNYPLNIKLFLYIFIPAVVLIQPAQTNISIVLLFLLVLWLFTNVVFNEKLVMDDVFYLLSMALFLVVTYKCGLYIREIDEIGRSAMIYVAIVTYMTDSGAYFVGRKLGKTKLNERISPKKTIEGSIGGTITGVVCGMIFAAFYNVGFDAWYIVLIASLILSITGQIGDLSLSAIKRHFAIKDFGNTLPGHGGILDRVDSLLFNFATYVSLMIIFAGVML